MIALDQLRAAFPRLDPARAALFLPHLNAAMVEFGINTPARMAAFLSQAMHESAHLSALVENLNYSAEGLLRTWPSRFNAASAAKYARRPEAIANFVYGGRMGNGPEQSGEGFKFRGRGIYQTTGKTNYTAAMMALDIDCVEHPELLEQPENACRSAGLFWSSRDLNNLADVGAFARITRAINGGTHGISERIALHDAARIALA